MHTRMTARDFDQELLILFDAYVHGDLSRRGFLSQARRFAKAGVIVPRRWAAGVSAALANFWDVLMPIRAAVELSDASSTT